MPNMEKHLFNLKIAAKELQHNSKKCDKEEKAEKAKYSWSLSRIHAENAIRQKHQSINLLRTSARVDAVASRVQTAVTMNQVTKSMSAVFKSMDATLKSMNLEKISALMNQFERHFETLDVQTVLMEDTMGSTSTLTTPQVKTSLVPKLPTGHDLMSLSAERSGHASEELSKRLSKVRDQAS
uniref:Uncharacterized protein n=1 Tax=Xiphophorus couchianus TaxID=32473 RepID=A0A3B5LWH0_9TELE